MNRRQFTQRLAALTAAPLIPVPLAAKAATPLATNNQHHLWATFIARIHDKASPQMFKRQLSLTDDQAQSVFNDLVQQKVLSVPNASGISNAMNPFKRNFTSGLASSPQSAFQSSDENKIIDKAKKLLDTEADVELENDSDTVNHDTSQCQDESETNTNPAEPPATDNA